MMKTKFMREGKTIESKILDFKSWGRGITFFVLPFLFFLKFGNSYQASPLCFIGFC